MTRTCLKCGEKLIINEKLALMECISGLHVEPINTIRPQWWNWCPECGQIGLNESNQERYTQKFAGNEPVIINGAIVMEEKNPDSIICKACNHTFTK